MPRINRRSFLSALGIGAGSLALASVLGPGRARAAGAQCPKRLVIIATQHGSVYSSWRLRPPGTGDGAAWEQDLTQLEQSLWSPILAELYNHRNQLLVVDGLSNTAGHSFIPHNDSNEHYWGQVGALTGSYMPVGSSETDIRASGPSLDRIVADQIAVSGRYRALNMGTSDQASPFFDTAGQPTPRQDLYQAFETLFGSPQGENPGEGDYLTARQSQVLELVAGEYQYHSQRFSADDRRKLDQHRTLVNDLRSRLAAGPITGCQAPNVGGDDTLAALGPNLADFIAAAFACDATRVITFNVHQLENSEFGAPPGDVHQDYAHDVDKNTAAGERAREFMTEYNRVQARFMSQILDALASVPEGSGSLLDNTLVMWSGELATGDHRMQPLPVVLAGGGAGFRTGRYLYRPMSNPTPQGREVAEDGLTGLPHQQLLVAIAQGFGAQINQIGIADYPNANGGRTSCTGPLDGLR